MKKAQIYAWHAQKINEQENGRRGPYIPCLKMQIHSLLSWTRKSYASRFYQLKVGHGAIGTFLGRQSPQHVGGAGTLSSQSCICTQNVESGGRKDES